MSKYQTMPAKLPKKVTISGNLVRSLKYGENGWMNPAGLYTFGDKHPLDADQFVQIEGMPASAVNVIDYGRLTTLAAHIAAGFTLNFGKVPYMVLIAKHGNVCGVGVGSTPNDAIRKAVTGDRRAQFGGSVLCNFPLNTVRAKLIKTYELGKDELRQFDTVAAPGFDQGAIDLLARRKTDKCRLLVNGHLAELGMESIDTRPRAVPVPGGFVFQPNYDFVLDLNAQGVVLLGKKLSVQQRKDIVLAWAIGSLSNSNTVTLVLLGQLLGNGVGQQDRVGAAELAIKRAIDAGHADQLAGAVAYSDSFFPYPDGPQALVDAGIGTVFTSFVTDRHKDLVAEVVCSDPCRSLVMVPDSICRGFAWH